MIFQTLTIPKRSEQEIAVILSKLRRWRMVVDGQKNQCVSSSPELARKKALFQKVNAMRVPV
jgi:hypothetical protein